MSCTKVYISDVENLCLLMHNDIDGFTFTVLNEDETAYDFTGKTDLFLKIYDRRRGNLLVTVPDSLTNGISVSANVITLNSNYAADIALFIAKKYYYEMSWIDTNSNLITVSLGDLEII